MAESCNEITVDRKLSEIFGEAYTLFNSFETCTDPVNSPEFQTNIKKCIKLFEDSTRLVSICGLFSTNEKYTELPTDDLKYFMLPFFLGNLCQKLCGGSRAEIVGMADVYFKDFLKRCSDYELVESNSDTTVSIANGSNGDKAAELARMVAQRNQKLEKYRIKKELEDEVKKLKIVLEREHIEDETKRDFFIKLLKLSVIDAQEELASIEQEKQILEFQKIRQQNNPEGDKKPPRRPVQPLKPIIITKDLAQKAVYGLGYPSFPTMTVSEFYDQRVRDGIFPDPNAPRKKNPNSLQERALRGDTTDLDEQEDIEREQKLDEDDDYEIARLRARDEYKDEHRRGEGNRHNRS